VTPACWGLSLSLSPCSVGRYSYSTTLWKSNPQGRENPGQGREIRAPSRLIRRPLPRRIGGHPLIETREFRRCVWGGGSDGAAVEARSSSSVGLTKFLRACRCARHCSTVAILVSRDTALVSRDTASKFSFSSRKLIMMSRSCSWHSDTPTSSAPHQVEFCSSATVTFSGCRGPGISRRALATPEISPQNFSASFQMRGAPYRGNAHHIRMAPLPAISVQRPRPGRRWLAWSAWSVGMASRATGRIREAIIWWGSGPAASS